MPTNPAQPAPIRVFLVDDHPGMRAGVAACIARQTDLVVCGEASTAAEALPAIVQTKPDVILADISLPGRDGLDLLKDILAGNQHARVLVFSMHDESLYAQRVLRVGARGYVTKSASLEELLSAIRRVRDGEFVLGQGVIDQMAAQAAAGNKPGNLSQLACLTDRELEVYRLLGQGLTRAEISNQLRLSPKTVETHRANMRQKLGIRTATALRQHAMEFLRAEAAGLHHRG